MPMLLDTYVLQGAGVGGHWDTWIVAAIFLTFAGDSKDAAPGIMRSGLRSEMTLEW